MRGRATLTLAAMAALLVLQATTRGQTSGHRVVVDLQPQGGTPESPLLLASDGSLYGTSCPGGQYGEGSIYRLTPAFQTLWPFRSGIDGACPKAGLTQASDGQLYGTTYAGGPGFLNDGIGTIFRIAPTGGPLEVLHTFRASGSGSPEGELLEYNGCLYGTASGGAAGAIFRFVIPAPSAAALGLIRSRGRVESVESVCVLQWS